ncbi:MAG TPA: hypothetical protein VGG19_04420 [Tepidisphaeraceae bacterium]|jgi:hypothetical protein
MVFPLSAWQHLSFHFEEAGGIEMFLEIGNGDLILSGEPFSSSPRGAGPRLWPSGKMHEIPCSMPMALLSRFTDEGKFILIV